MEFYQETPTLYVDEARIMMSELRQTKDELICEAFPDPDTGELLGPLLPLSDCATLEGELDQVEQKFNTCIDSLFAAQEGNSAENCNAYFTKMQNLRDVATAAAWPVAPDPVPGEDLRLFEPNYEGEFFVRIDAFEFLMSNYVLKTVPADGIVVP
ncbi:MAG: hypothetical protein P8Y02_01475 [Deinococcales bacterium]